MKNYIGLTANSHDPSLAIVNSNGELVFAEATERYLQNKRAWFYRPDDLIRLKKLFKNYLEEGADLVIARTWSKPPLLRSIFANFFLYTIYNNLEKNLFHLKNLTEPGTKALIGQLMTDGCNIDYIAKEMNPDIRISRKYYDHHLTHAVAACMTSPFSQALCLIVDGIGENYSVMAVYRYEDGSLTKHMSMPLFRHYSLGFFYEYVCAACGFKPLEGEEWKVMGLASYGKFDPAIDEIFRDIFVFKDGMLARTKNTLSAEKKLVAMTRGRDESPYRMADLAHTGQKYFCENMFKLINHYHGLMNTDNLVLGGGCFLNSSCNGKILENTKFRNVHIFSAPGDDGNSVGAAIMAYLEDNENARVTPGFQSPYLGERLNDFSIQNFLKYNPLKPTPLGSTSVEVRAAEILARGKIIGWVQGRAEFGPRALGNRSILADPRPADMKDRINANVKYREEFRPFAPSILHEFGNEYFENYQESPYMERTLRFKKDVVEKVPAVVHVDGTGRLQTVKKEWNEKYYNLIKAFYEITGIPLIVNTSYNVMGKPIISSVEDAVSVFYTSGIDALVIGDYLFEKP
ncbi:MAG: carbamoyltransferase [Oligoflexales bacterium]|nr:carbamoyltransferase [Oligoflexales bacterium]